MGHTLLLALGLVLIVEGLLPFINPAAWRRVFEQATRMADGQIRVLGLVSLTLGVLVLLVV